MYLILPKWGIFFTFLHFCTIYTIRTFWGKTQLFWQKIELSIFLFHPQVLAVLPPSAVFTALCYTVTQCPRSYWTGLGTSPNCNETSRVQTSMLAESRCYTVTWSLNFTITSANIAPFFSFLAPPDPEMVSLVEGKPSTRWIFVEPWFPKVKNLISVLLREFAYFLLGFAHFLRVVPSWKKQSMRKWWNMFDDVTFFLHTSAIY